MLDIKCCHHERPVSYEVVEKSTPYITDAVARQMYGKQAGPLMGDPSLVTMIDPRNKDGCEKLQSKAVADEALR